MRAGHIRTPIRQFLADGMSWPRVRLHRRRRPCRLFARNRPIRRLIQSDLSRPMRQRVGPRGMPAVLRPGPPVRVVAPPLSRRRIGRRSAGRSPRLRTAHWLGQIPPPPVFPRTLHKTAPRDAATHPLAIPYSSPGTAIPDDACPRDQPARPRPRRSSRHRQRGRAQQLSSITPAVRGAQGNELVVRGCEMGTCGAEVAGSYCDPAHDGPEDGVELGAREIGRPPAAGFCDVKPSVTRPASSSAPRWAR